MLRETWKKILVVVFLFVFFVLIPVKPMLAVALFMIVMLVGIGAKIRKEQKHFKEDKC